MSVDELAIRRADNARRVAGARRRPPPPDQSEPNQGDISVIVEDLLQIRGMAEEVMAEALALDDTDVIAAVGALILHVSDVVATTEQARGGD